MKFNGMRYTTEIRDVKYADIPITYARLYRMGYKYEDIVKTRNDADTYDFYAER